MRPLLRLVGTTVVGGLVFLVPVVLTVVVVTQAMRLAVRVLAPVAHAIPLHSVAGIALANMVAALLIVAACFGAGLLARTRTGSLVNRRLERVILRRIPAYTFVKSAVEALAGLEGNSEVRSALARVEDAWVPAFIVEQHANGLCTVFVPSVPTPAAGTVYLLGPERVHPIDVPVTAMVGCIMRLGVGLRELLESAGASASGLVDAAPGER